LSRAGRAGVDAGLHNNLLRIVWCAVRRCVVVSDGSRAAPAKKTRPDGRV